MASTPIYTLLHMVDAGCFIFSIYYMIFHVHLPTSDRVNPFDPGQVKYLTIWNTCLECDGEPKEYVKTNYRTRDAKSQAMRDRLLIGFHAIACVQFAFSVYYDHTYTIVPREVGRMHQAYGGKFKFLTFWDAIMQAAFYLICLANDFYGNNEVNPKKRPLFRRIKDYFHASLAFPVAMFVGITFWALMFVDRELVLPIALDPYFPSWLNHLMHTMIMISTILEMIVAPRQYPKRTNGLGGLLIFMATYLLWLHIIYAKSGIWVYPVMDVLSFPMRIAFFLILFAFTAILYAAGEVLNNLIWGNAQSEHRKSHFKSK